MKAIKDFFAAFTTNPHVQALKNLADRNGDGKIDMKDVEAEVASVKAQLELKQASYYHSAIAVVIALATGAWLGHRFL